MKLMINTEESMTSNREKELFRMLRSNIEFTGVENRVIAVTSCLPNDGKSTISYQLAYMFAEEGKRTLLVDADLRKSILLKQLQVEGAQKGLSHLLSGLESVGEAVHATNIPNFFLLPSGIFPANPTELLANERFKKLIQAFKNSFEYVIIDTPPIGSVIDAAVIAKECDGSLFVLASDKVSRREARRMVEQMRSANPNILGAVLNKVDVRGSSYYGKKYKGYYKGSDGYVYGE